MTDNTSVIIKFVLDTRRFVWNFYNGRADTDTERFAVDLEASDFREKMNGSVIKVNETRSKP